MPYNICMNLFARIK